MRIIRQREEALRASDCVKKKDLYTLIQGTTHPHISRPLVTLSRRSASGLNAPALPDSHADGDQLVADHM